MFAKDIKGFTVLEMMIIVILIGIIGIAVIPSVGMVRKQEVRKLAKEMCLDLTTQRMRAMTAGKMTGSSSYGFELVEDLESGHYYSYELTPSFDTASGQVRKVNKDNSNNIHITMEALHIKTFAEEVPLREVIHTVYFDNYGSMLKIDEFSTQEIEELTIKLTYDLAETKIVFNGVTGYYSID
ncbi:hypothetical protein [Cellulosilyticum sp. I15G10I2]|uniref:hypothetical protein n=1 Tax=Cellulosilyticum sp. I15G10I2 TaxID=1892843 RepID=UPI00085CC50E|nr:hypothetical protein [Cellulosilyticum sp. I15G10I2]